MLLMYVLSWEITLSYSGSTLRFLGSCWPYFLSASVTSFGPTCQGSLLGRGSRAQCPVLLISCGSRGVCTRRCSSFPDCDGAQHNKLRFITINVSIKLSKTGLCLEISSLECAGTFRSFSLALCKNSNQSRRERDLWLCELVYHVPPH